MVMACAGQIASQSLQAITALLAIGIAAQRMFARDSAATAGFSREDS